MKKKIKYLSQSGVFTRIVLPIILVIILAIIGWVTFKNQGSGGELSIEDAKIQTEEFINSSLMAPGTEATVVEIVEENGLYKVSVDIVSDIVESYVTKDGKLFFPQAFNVAQMQNGPSASGENAQAPQANVEVPKTAKPNVELFVMSHCPFGTQIEKGILPVIDALGDKIDFELKFVDYAMHGEIELQEQMVQYCIQEEQNDKFVPYLECFLVDGETDSCLAEANINQNSLDSCVEDVDSEYSIMDNFKNNVGYQGSYPGFDIHKADNTKYGVAGSPTLIINETEVPSARDPQGLLNTICNAFEEVPAECEIELPTDTPAAGFGTGTTPNTGATAAAACN